MGIESLVKYEPSFLIYFSFDARDLLTKCEDRPDVENAKSELAVDHNVFFDKEEGRLQCNGMLDVTWTLRFEEGEEDIEFVTKCGMLGAASCECAEEDEEALKGVLAPNLVVYLWGKIRDQIERASLATPLDRMILPAINPIALLNDED